MDQLLIFRPVLALVALTFSVLLRIPYVRVRAVRARRMTVDDLKPGESSAVPSDVSLPNRNYMNLLELPVLFYTLALALFVTGKVDATQLTLAWSYVALRVLHSAIHLTSNNVFHRLFAFAFSNLVLSGMWLRFALRVL